MPNLDQLAYNLRRPLAAFFPALSISLDLGRGTAFPTVGYDGGAIVTDSRFYRTDLDFLCVYDGARWLSVHTEVMRIPLTAYSANTTDTTVLQVLPTDYAVQLVRMEIYAKLGATNNGSNFWFYQLQRNTVNITGALTTALGTGGADYQLGTDLTTIVTIGGYINIAVAKSGAPSNINVASMVRYRLIIT